METPRSPTGRGTYIGPDAAIVIRIMDRDDCPFCRLEKDRIRLEGEFAVAFPDGFPVAEGHTLVIPKRHVASLFDLPEEEQAAVWRLVAQVRAMLHGRACSPMGSTSASTTARRRGRR